MLLVASPPVQDLLLSAKDLFVAARTVHAGRETATAPPHVAATDNYRQKSLNLSGASSV